MVTLKKIIKEMEDVPVDRLEELYQFVNSLSVSSKKNESIRKKILSFGGAFKDMKEDEFSDFVNYTRKSRVDLFSRNSEI